MKNLTLSQLNISLYQNNVACAYVYYDNHGHPQDQFNHPIGTFYQDPFQFENHLRSVVLPIINNKLKASNYTALDIGFENQAPHPFIIIMRKDKAQITSDDLSAIRNKLNNLNTPNRLGMFADNVYRPKQQGGKHQHHTEHSHRR